MPKVFNKRAIGIPTGAIYIGRGSKWGNPFRIGKDGDRATVIVKHEAWLRDQHYLLRAIGELRGEDLVCFCAPAPCHGDLLLRLANGSREEMIRWWRAGADNAVGTAGTAPERQEPPRARRGLPPTP
jgi:Domain of unknown function (DUF4326)